MVNTFFEHNDWLIFVSFHCIGLLCVRPRLVNINILPVNTQVAAEYAVIQNVVGTVNILSIRRLRISNDVARGIQVCRWITPGFVRPLTVVVLTIPVVVLLVWGATARSRCDDKCHLMTAFVAIDG